MGDRGSASRRSAANLYRAGWHNNKYSAGAKPIYAGSATGLLSHSDGFGSLSGAGDDAETDADSKAAAGEYEYIGDASADTG